MPVKPVEYASNKSSAPKLEIAVQDIAGLKTATSIHSKYGSPDRIELCSALSLGGITPSTGLIEQAAMVRTPVHVLVRPRGGDFVYSAEERQLIVADSGAAIKLGAAGVVIGGLKDGFPDMRLVKEVKQLIGDAELTFHRAFDTLTDKFSALDMLASNGVTRVLTSGGADQAPNALAELTRLAQHASGAIEIMAGGGISIENVDHVLATGVSAVHASAKHTISGEPTVALGAAAASGISLWETTDEYLASQLVEAVQAWARELR